MAKSEELSENEKLLFSYLNKGNDQEVLKLLNLPDVRVNCLDEHGMTPLMCAAYKGKAEMCELLIAQGADVNSNYHEHQYTSLMFSCLSGSVDATRVLLEAGARVNAENNLGRTAAQLGAFVGQTDCVSLINNFLSVEDLEYFTKPRGLEKEPRLSAALVPVLHKFAVSQKLSPIKIVMNLQDNMVLVENSKSLVNVLELLAEANVKGKEMNEVLAMKMHYLAFILKKCARWHNSLEGKGGIEGLIKYLTKGRSSDGFFINEEDLVRQAIKEFDYHECTIFKQLVQTIAPVEKGQDPTALSVLTQTVNGLRCADFSGCCVVCTEKRNVKKCSSCKMVGYCSVTCQKLHWSTHKKFCKQLAKEYEKELALKLKEEKLTETINAKDQDTNQINGEQEEASGCSENDKTEGKECTGSTESKPDVTDGRLKSVSEETV
ncbi:ankyrin repeat and MYND domain-containing protein 2-like [Acropora palmata]|uniref:ankyrin repeat and MYND domain-containing protein 2-like n=1 Tax=Acropora palmata TaxID=6131 RepID=UPI003DA03ACB